MDSSLDHEVIKCLKNNVENPFSRLCRVCKLQTNNSFVENEFSALKSSVNHMRSVSISNLEIGARTQRQNTRIIMILCEICFFLNPTDLIFRKKSILFFTKETDTTKKRIKPRVKRFEQQMKTK